MKKLKEIATLAEKQFRIFSEIETVHLTGLPSYTDISFSDDVPESISSALTAIGFKALKTDGELNGTFSNAKI